MLSYAIDLNSGRRIRGLGWLGQVQPEGALVVARGHDVWVSISIQVADPDFEIVRNTETRSYKETFTERAVVIVQANGRAAARIRQNYVRRSILIKIRDLGPGDDR